MFDKYLHYIVIQLKYTERDVRYASDDQRLILEVIVKDNWTHPRQNYNTNNTILFIDNF